jgi:hypothetical protein
MPLAPIRGAPPGAPIPDFPGVVPAAETLRPPAPAAATAHHPPAASPSRRSYAPVEIAGDEATLTFRVVPELPAIRRSSLLVHVSTDATGERSPRLLASFELSPERAERFLAALLNRHAPMVISGDAAEPLEIACAFTASGLIFTVQESGGGTALRRFSIDRTCDVTAMADHLLADLGTAG